MTTHAHDALVEISKAATFQAFSNLESLITQYQTDRTTFEKLVGCDENCLAFTQTCAVSISQAALGLELKAGDEILNFAGEYPSNTYPWIEAARRSGASYKQVEAEEGFRFTEEAIINKIDSKTKVVAVSWVQFQNGWLIDLKKISEAAHNVGALLVVDVIQGLGIIPFNMKELGVDVVCGGTHKWLCGPLGLGFLAVSKDLIQQLKPLCVGSNTFTDYEELATDLKRKPYTDYRRFEPGSPFFIMARTAAASIEQILKAGVENINHETRVLRNLITTTAETRGFKTLSQQEGKFLSPTVTVLPNNLEKSIQQLREKNILFAHRLGGIRLSPHVYNNKDDIDRAMNCLC